MKALGSIGILSLVVALIWTVVSNQRAEVRTSPIANERSARSDRSRPDLSTPADHIGSLPAAKMADSQKTDRSPNRPPARAEGIYRPARSVSPLSKAAVQREDTLLSSPPSRTTGRSSPADGRAALSSSRSSSSAALAAQDTRQEVSQPNTQQVDTLPQPAVWADLSDVVPAGSEMDIAIQQEAERLLEEISAIPVGDDPEAYRKNWQDAVSRSDQLFRSRYGGWMWMSHHIQAYHLAASQEQQAETK